MSKQNKECEFYSKDDGWCNKSIEMNGFGGKCENIVCERQKRE